MDAELEWGIGRAVGREPLFRHVRIQVGTTWYSAQIVEVMRIVTHPAPPRSELHLLEYVDKAGAHPFTDIPYGDEVFAWAVQRLAHMVHVPPAAVDIQIAGERVPVDLDRLPPGDTAKFVRSIWCPVANMASERPYGPGARETRHGSKHFAAGAKLYCVHPFWGDGGEQIEVIGRHRATHRYVSMVVSSSWLTNWRVDLAYSPYLIRALWPAWDGTQRSKEKAEHLVDAMQRRIQTRA